MPERIIASTQNHLDIEAVKDGVIITKSGGAAVILEASSVNFDLLSEREQDAAIASYSALLNSISFQLQIIVRSKIMDITTYVENIKAREAQESHNLKTKEGLVRYRRFVEELVTKNKVLDKKFYVVIPYFAISLKPATDPFFWLKSLVGVNSKKSSKLNTDAIYEKAVLETSPKRDHLIKEFTRLNIKARQLRTEEIIELFYDIYNPDSARIQKIRTSHEDYQTPIVEPRLAAN